MPYVDGFVIPIPADKLEVYRKIAAKAGKVWLEHGALEYCECVGDDLEVETMVSFPKLAKTKAGETVVFSWITFKNKAHRDKVNAKVMKDPRLEKMMKDTEMPFNMKRMAYGGFKTIVDL